MKRLAFALVPLVFAACSVVVDVDRFNAGGGAEDASSTNDSVASDVLGDDTNDANDATAATDTIVDAIDAPPARRPQVFVAGGNVAGTNEKSVLRAEITETGDLTSWEAAESMPVSSSACQATRSGKNVYVVGPDFVTGNALTVRFTSFDGAGKLSPWSGQKTWPPHSRVIAASNASFLYALGGTPEGSSTATSSAFVALIGSDGAPGAFTATRALPLGRAAGCAVVVNDNLYVLGGYTNEGDTLKTVIRASIASDGSLGPWVAQADLTYTTIGSGCAAVGKRIYVFGGYGAQDVVQHALIDSSGSIGSWVTGPKIPTQHAYFQAAVAGGYVVVAGGFGGPSTPSDKVEIAPISEASVGPWKSAEPLPGTRVFVSAFGYD